MQPVNIMALSDGCLALFNQQIELAAEGAISFEYQKDSLLIEHNGIEVLVPAAYFDHMFSSAFEAEGGTVVNIHLYCREEGVYEAVFVGSLSVEAQTFIKAKGVAEYLSSATP